MANLKQLSERPNPLAPGHRTCAGCTAPTVVRQVLGSIEEPVVVGCATGCLMVTTTIYPYTSWNVPYIHNAFENVAATIAGVEAAYQALRSQGKVDRDIKFVAIGGDGGTYDIGLQALSGAMERGHDMLYLCYDNGAYMNTGVQRSGATPTAAHTTTAPAGRQSSGKPERRKDMTAIMVAHGVPYVAQASPHNWRDLNRKVEAAMSVEGPKYMAVLAPCTVGWGFDASEAIEMARLAVETCFWPLYEVVDGECRVTYKPREKKPLVEFLKAQARFKHLFRGDHGDVIESLQQQVDEQWHQLLLRAGEIG